MNAREWLLRDRPERPDVALLGAPISKASLSPSQAWSTPPAFRGALQRFQTWDAQHRIDVAELSIRDHGDLTGDRDEPDAAAAHQRIETACAEHGRTDALVVVIGGDNSLTAPAMRGVMAARPEAVWGLVTVDAHHDCRPLHGGPRNGNPVRDLIEGGLSGPRVVQLGINPVANDPAHARWAAQRGVHVVPLHRLRAAGVHAAAREAQRALRHEGVNAVYVDFDIDVADRAFAPACPASMPGGLQPAELVQLARLLGRELPAAAADITEVDAAADVAAITLRLAAAVFLAFCAGVATRPTGGHR